MELKIRVLCRPEIAAGFELAGVPVETTSDPQQAKDRVERWAKDPSIGVVLVEDPLHRALPPELLFRLSRRGVPLVAGFPAPSWQEKDLAEAYVLEILRRAIGYRVRPR
jgi:vacuolar-type H+-ATPase subunit F/Vma7